MTAQEKAKQQAEVMLAFAGGAEVEIQRTNCEWVATTDPKWDWICFNYRVKVVPKVVKYYCYTDGHTLIWVARGETLSTGWKAVPSEDKEITL